MAERFLEYLLCGPCLAVALLFDVLGWSRPLREYLMGPPADWPED